MRSLLLPLAAGSLLVSACASTTAPRPPPAGAPTSVVSPTAVPARNAVLASLPSRLDHVAYFDLRGGTRAQALAGMRFFRVALWSSAGWRGASGEDPLARVDRILEGSFEADWPHWLTLVTGEVVGDANGLTRGARGSGVQDGSGLLVEETPLGPSLFLATGYFPGLRTVWSGQEPSLADDPEFAALGPSEEGAVVSLWARGINSNRSGAEILLYGARHAQVVAHALGDEALFDAAFPWYPVVRLEVVVRADDRVDYVITALQRDDAAAGAATGRVRARWAAHLERLEGWLMSHCPVDPARVRAAVPAFVALARREARFETVGRAVRIVVPDNEILTACEESISAEDQARYDRLRMSSEAESNLYQMRRAAAALVAQRTGRRTSLAIPFASAPRTPAEVPRGVAVTDPPGTWQHPTWRALDFELRERHRFTYEVEVRGRSVTFRAFGDLDADGDVSTFEHSCEINDAGELEHDWVRSRDPSE